jgi:hypothetical protein
MKMLLYLADMVRGDLFNPVNGKSFLEKHLSEQGGIYWNNAFTPAPDTPRSVACLLSGMYPKGHGVSTRGCGLLESFDSGNPSLFKLISDSGIPVGVWRSQKEIEENFWLPKDCLDSVEQFSKKQDVVKWIGNKEDFLLYRHENSYHNLVHFAKNFKNPHKVGLDTVYYDFIETQKISDFDSIWFFSDHGCIFPRESSDSKDLLNDNRTKIALFKLEKEGPQRVIKNNKLCAIFDLYPTILRQMGISFKNIGIDGLDLNSKSEHSQIWIDDWLSLYPGDFEIPSLYVKKNLDSTVMYIDGDFFLKSTNNELIELDSRDKNQLEIDFNNQFTHFRLARNTQRRGVTINQYAESNKRQIVDIIFYFIPNFVRFIQAKKVVLNLLVKNYTFKFRR